MTGASFFVCPPTGGRASARLWHHRAMDDASPLPLVLHRSRDCWSAQRRLTAGLLLLWVAASFGVAWFAPALSSIEFFGWPLSFYMAAQGSPLAFIVLVALYSRAAQRVEQRVLAAEDGHRARA